MLSTPMPTPMPTPTTTPMQQRRCWGYFKSPLFFEQVTYYGKWKFYRGMVSGKVNWEFKSIMGCQRLHLLTMKTNILLPPLLPYKITTTAT